MAADHGRPCRLSLHSPYNIYSCSVTDSRRTLAVKDAFELYNVFS